MRHAHLTSEPPLQVHPLRDRSSAGAEAPRTRPDADGGRVGTPETRTPLAKDANRERGRAAHVTATERGRGRLGRGHAGDFDLVEPESGVTCPARSAVNLRRFSFASHAGWASLKRYKSSRAGAPRRTPTLPVPCVYDAIKQIKRAVTASVNWRAIRFSPRCVQNAKRFRVVVRERGKDHERMVKHAPVR